MSSNERGRLLRLNMMRQIRLSPRARQALHSLALAVSIAALAVAAIELSRWHPHAERVAGSRRPPGASGPSLVHDQRLIAVSAEPPLGEARQTNPAPVLSVAAATAASAPAAIKFKSASELFADATRARVRGDTAAAIALGQQIELTFPYSTEGITTHLSLGVLYLQQGDASLALQEFKIYRHIGAAEKMAEALWGEEQAYQKLGRPNEERPVLEELLANYPHSAYAAAAAQRLAALNH
jgi:tetratricopeptide (TPR) repeat protein